MLTHQNERPEKCPITTCEYHVKGFARKYDKNRHTLTHYKGTMVCGFCPGSGSAAEKSFNRADVFKRHLTTVHGVEQNPPNSRKKSPGGRKPYSSTWTTVFCASFNKLIPAKQSTSASSLLLQRTKTSLRLLIAMVCPRASSILSLRTTTMRKTSRMRTRSSTTTITTMTLMARDEAAQERVASRAQSRINIDN
jgi:hypothetical protein